MRETALPPADVADDVLIAQIAGGDQDALAALYDRYGDLVYSFFLRMLGDPAIAGELVQVTFLRVWDSASSLSRTDLAVDGRILELAHALGISAARARRADGESGYAGAGATGADVSQALPTLRAAHEPVRWMGNRHRIREALQELARDQRRTLELCYFHGYSLEEIAGLYDEPRATAEERLRAGLRDLSQALAPIAQPAER